MSEAIVTDPTGDAPVGANGLDTPGQTVPDGVIDTGSDDSASADENVSIPSREHKSLRTIQSKYDQLNERLGGLAQLVEQHGGEAVMDLLGQYNTLTQNPQMAQIIRDFQANGTLPGAQATTEEDDPYKDPEVKALEDQLAAVTQRLEAVTGEVQGINRQQGMAQLSAYTEEFSNEYLKHATEEQVNEYLQKMERHWENMLRTPEGQAQAKNMTKQTHRMLSLDAIEGFRGEIERRRLQEQARERQGMATDAPAGFAAHGTEAQPRPELPNNMAQLKKLAQSTMAEAIRRNRG